MPSHTTPDALRHHLGEGVLSFPLTDFDSADEFDARSFTRRLDWLSGYGAKALFAAGGAGEFFSLTADEYRAVVRTAVGFSGGTVPVIAASGYGTRMAIEFAQEAERLGADGILLLPPYLTEASADGLREHIAAVCRATRLGVIVYNRANVRIRAEALPELLDACPNLIGFKDGVGEIEEVMKIRAMVGDRVAMINGMPTAEVYAPAYFGLGVPVYSSAILNFIPKSAMAFQRAVADGDRAAVDRFTRDFLAPYGRLRARQPGYAVSIVKAGADIVGRSAGRVRPPLAPLTTEECAALAALIERQGPQH